MCAVVRYSRLRLLRRLKGVALQEVVIRLKEGRSNKAGSIN